LGRGSRAGQREALKRGGAEALVGRKLHPSDYGKEEAEINKNRRRIKKEGRSQLRWSLLQDVVWGSDNSAAAAGTSNFNTTGGENGGCKDEIHNSETMDRSLETKE